MAAPFFRYQSKARKALKPGQRLQYIQNQGYRLVPGGKPRWELMTPKRPTGSGTPTVSGQPRTPTSPLGRPTYEEPNEAALWEEARQRAGQISDPILAMIARRQQQEEDQRRADFAAQSAATDKAYQDARAPLAGVYQSAIQQETAIEDAVSKRLQGQGAAQGEDLAKKLAQMGAPGQAGDIQQLATTYKGADAAEYAKGMSDVGRLVARGAEARAWLEKQPALAKQQMASDLNEALTELSKQYGADREEILANLPTQIQDLYEGLLGTRSQQAQGKYERGLGDWEAVQEQRRYQQGRADQLKAAKQEAAAARQKAILVAQASMDKQAFAKWKVITDRQFKAQQNEFDRQIKQDLENQKQLGQDTRTQAQIDAENARSRATNRRIVSENAKNRAANKKNPTGDTPAQTRLKTNTARSNINSILYNTSSTKSGTYGNQTTTTSKVLKQEYRDFQVKPNTPGGLKKYFARANKVAAAINRQIRLAGLAPESATGRSIRTSYLRELGIPVGAGGYPSPSGK